MKKTLMFALALTVALLLALPALADPSDAAPYSVVSAQSNKTYDFGVDFAPWVHDDMSPGDTFILADDRPDVTLTLKNDLTGETFVYEPTAETAWDVEAETPTLLYETTRLDATLVIGTLGDAYGIRYASVPLTVTVASSPEAAIHQKYFDVTNGLSTDLTEGVDFTIDRSTGDGVFGAAITLLHAPAAFHLDLYDFETGETVSYYGDDPHLTFDFATELGYHSQTDDTYYFPLDGKLTLDDGYEYEFTLNVHAHPADVAVSEPAPVTSVATGDPLTTAYLAVLLLSGAAALAALLRRNRTAT